MGIGVDMGGYGTQTGGFGVELKGTLHVWFFTTNNSKQYLPVKRRHRTIKGKLGQSHLTDGEKNIQKL